MPLLPQDIRKFQNKIFHWWKTHRRDLPWRHIHDPYRIMVSEVMLQQTQVSRVLPKYTEFIKSFPTVQSLARASTSDVLKIWKGMGYNRRALYLHKAAQIISKKYDNQFPPSIQLLSSFPGIGTYTARAILVFAFKKDIAMVDTNIRKIITHFFFKDIKQPEKVIQEVADQLVPTGKSWEWHQALMDFGAIELKNVLLLSPFTPNHPNPPNLTKKIPFYESTRFFRGRIMDLVREKKWKEKELIKTMIRKHGKDAKFYQDCIGKLLQEGLLTHSSPSIISLPE